MPRLADLVVPGSMMVPNCDLHGKCLTHFDGVHGQYWKCNQLTYWRPGKADRRCDRMASMSAVDGLIRAHDKPLRNARKLAHWHFDMLWKRGKWTRMLAYAWLARETRLGNGNAHIGHLTIAGCEMVIGMAKSKCAELGLDLQLSPVEE